MKLSHSNALRNIVCTMLLGATGLVPAFAKTGGGSPLDVGSMALPTSPQQASSITFRAARPTTFDTSNMAYPVPQPQGVISQTTSSARYRDTGNMAFADPRPQGDLASRSR